MTVLRNSSAEFLLRASRILKALGHPVRLEMVKYLQDGEHSVAEIQNHLNIIQSVTSQHLRLMYKKGIVKYRREGTTRYYSIANEFIGKILTCFTECESKLQSDEWKTAWLGYEIEEEERVAR